MQQYNYSDEFYHHGVKGMRWGVRRSNKNKPSSVRKKRVKTKSSEKSIKKSIRTGKKFTDKVRNLSRKEMLQGGAAVASGILWTTSALATGNLGPALNAAASIANLTNIAIGIHKDE